MEQVLVYCAFGFGGVVIGFIMGALVIRANYKHFRDHEAEMKTMILDAGTSAEQIVMRLRNRIKI